MVQNAFIFPYTSEKKISFSLEVPTAKNEETVKIHDKQNETC